MGCINSKNSTVKAVKAPVTNEKLNIVMPEVSAWDDGSSPQKASPVKSELKSPFLSPASPKNSGINSAKKNSSGGRADSDSEILLN